MSDITIKISVDPATEAIGVSSDAGAGPAPTEVAAAGASAETTADAPGPAVGVLAETDDTAVAMSEIGPAPVEPSQLGTDIAAEGTAVGEAAPPPEDFDVLDATAVAATEADDAPGPIPLADLEAEATTKAKPKAKPRRQTKKKA